MKMTKKPVIPRTITLNVQHDGVAVVAHPDCLVVLSVTRVPWLSNDDEERERQLCRTLQLAVADADGLGTTEHDIVPPDPSWWPLPMPKRN